MAEEGQGLCTLLQAGDPQVLLRGRPLMSPAPRGTASSKHSANSSHLLPSHLSHKPLAFGDARTTAPAAGLQTQRRTLLGHACPRGMGEPGCSKGEGVVRTGAGRRRDPDPGPRHQAAGGGFTAECGVWWGAQGRGSGLQRGRRNWAGTERGGGGITRFPVLRFLSLQTRDKNGTGPGVKIITASTRKALGTLLGTGPELDSGP